MGRRRQSNVGLRVVVALVAGTATCGSGGYLAWNHFGHWQVLAIFLTFWGFSVWQGLGDTLSEI